MPRLKEFDCSVCGCKHPRPVGRNCSRNQDAASASVATENPDISVASASSKASSLSFSDDIGAKILQSLNNVNDRLDRLDRRVRRTEEAMAARSDRSVVSNSSPLTSPEILGGAHSTSRRVNTNPKDSVVPSLDFVRTNEEINAQASQRMSDLKGAAAVSKGKVSSSHSHTKLVSQRGAGDIRIKCPVDWPNNFVLVGPNKETTSYANLTWPQWVTGCMKMIQYQSDPVEKEIIFDFITSLMEDAMDFSFQGAKACLNVVLDSIEKGRMVWSDKDLLERHRRSTAQRHVSKEKSKSPESKNVGKHKNKKNKSMPCKFFHAGHCSISPESHWTNGVYYTHSCGKCGATHPTKSCTERKSKNL